MCVWLTLGLSIFWFYGYDPIIIVFGIGLLTALMTDVKWHKVRTFAGALILLIATARGAQTLPSVLHLVPNRELYIDVLISVIMFVCAMPYVRWRWYYVLLSVCGVVVLVANWNFSN